jgi:SEC-C motif/Nuclease-related domain
MSKRKRASLPLVGSSLESQFGISADTERTILEELGRLCVSPGYIQALAFICFNDNVVGIGNELSGEDLLKMHSRDRLIRTEINTLVGLMVKHPIDFTLPETATTQNYFDETLRLMKALHQAMSSPVFDQITPGKLGDPSFNPFAYGSVLREPIFYSAEAAYAFQFRDLAVPKYVADNAWLKQNKGFSIDEAHRVFQTFTEAQNRNLTTLLESFRQRRRSEWSVLDGFSVTPHEIAHLGACDVQVVRKVLSAFALPDGDRNPQFQSLHDFNACTATPLLKRGHDTFIVFSHHSLMQSLYESPFYWMINDSQYKETASANRGQFAEEFVRQRLEHVFGDKRVFQGVKVLESKGNERTDIDVLALFGNRAIVVQAKSKKLTLEARKGNDGQIKADFKKAVQDAYDQGYAAASALLNPAFKFRDNTGQPLQIPKLKEVFIVTILSEAYPALAFQARQFLRVQSTEAIRLPIVTDVFSIDTMTEMLESPVWLIDYLRRRSEYSEKLHVPDELTTLSYHLTRNLWLGDQYDMVLLTDDISCDLDAAMTVRRDGVPGKRTPDGILTKFAGTTIDRILKQIEAKPEPATLEFAFTVLSCDEETVKQLSQGIDKAGDLFDHDGKGHNFTMSIRSIPVTGVIAHCNRDALDVAWRNLRSHCEDRKYFHKADNWFGICVDPHSKKLRLGIGLEFPWKQDPAMDLRTSSLQDQNVPNVGPNDQCPCGSGKKYKRCHMC